MYSGWSVQQMTLIHVKWFHDFSFLDSTLSFGDALTPFVMWMMLGGAIRIGSLVFVDGALSSSCTTDWSLSAMASDRLLPFVTTVVIAANVVVTTRKNDISHVIAVPKRVSSESEAGGLRWRPAYCCSEPWLYL